MDPHLQEQASLCLVVEGSYREKIHALEHEHRPRHLLYYPLANFWTQRREKDHIHAEREMGRSAWDGDSLGISP